MGPALANSCRFVYLWGYELHPGFELSPGFEPHHCVNVQSVPLSLFRRLLHLGRNQTAFSGIYFRTAVLQLA